MCAMACGRREFLCFYVYVQRKHDLSVPACLKINPHTIALTCVASSAGRITIYMNKVKVIRNHDPAEMTAA